MARPRTPTAILEAKGAFDKNPQRGRARAGEPRPRIGIGDPPDDLPDDVRACWHDIVSCCAPGVLTCADRIAVLSTARLLARENKGIISTGERGQLHRMLAEMGMTPKGRAYVQVDPDNEQEANSLTAI